MTLPKFEKIYENQKSTFLEGLKAFLSIPSVSTDPAYHNECDQCADWLKSHLEQIGLTAEIIPTEGRPVVYAERKVADAGAKTLLFYGHYDVQPVDPVHLWETKPFEPVEREGRLYARGAQDNKGQLFYVLKALQTVIAEDALSCNVKILIEGEEECGSGAIIQKLPEIASRLKADVLLVCDTGTPDERIGCITMGLRGVMHFEVKLTGPSKDLHSGVHGGLVKNPITELCRLVASLHDEDGKIAVPGFYDQVVEVSAEDRALANAYALDFEDYRRKVGALPMGGEKGIPPMERRGLRPTIELNGIYGGYQGDGSKTIIPSYAVAKCSARIVANQDPEYTLDLILEYLRTKTPIDLHIEFPHSAAAGTALLVSSHNPVIKKAGEILKEVMGTEALYLWEGASIPLIPALRDASGAQPVLVGFGLEEDNIHAPNESFSLEQFRRGYLFSSLLLSTL